jgi:hypothetical protein
MDLLLSLYPVEFRRLIYANGLQPAVDPRRAADQVRGRVSENVKLNAAQVLQRALRYGDPDIVNRPLGRT